MYPYCTEKDVERLRIQRPGISATSKLTSTQAADTIKEIASQMNGVLTESGYDIDNIFETSDTVALGITAGASVAVIVTDGSQFAKGNEIKIEGLVSGEKKWEYDHISAVSSNTLTIATVDYTYDAGSVTIKIVNSAMQVLRKINALGAAAEIEESLFMGVAPNESTHSDKFWERYWGSEDKPGGIWAIQNIPGYLDGATTTDNAKIITTIFSYGSEHEDDTDVQPLATIEDLF